MPRKPEPPPAGGATLRFLFLASHGLQTPLSAIRWGASRLKKDAKKLSKQQQNVVDHIHANARVLSRIFNAMLILARSEDHAYELKPERVTLKPLLATQMKEAEPGAGLQFTLSCPPSLAVETDNSLLETVVQSLFALFAEAAHRPQKVTCTASRRDDAVCLSLTGKLELSLLQSNDEHAEAIVGGTPGLLLSLSYALTSFLGGTLELRQRKDDQYEVLLLLPI